MAKNKVEVDVIVDDKGTTKKLGLESKKAAQGLDQAGKSARTADRNLKGASQQSANGTKNFSKMAQGMQGGLVPAYATFAASVFALTAVFQGLKEAADFRVVKDAQIAFSSATGVGMMTLTSQIKSATDGLVGFKEASQAAAIGTASGLGVQQIQNLAKGAREVSLILGRDVTDSFNRLIRGVTKAEPELLDELGITLRLKDATENYAASIGKAANQLSLYERSQAVAAEVQDQLDRKYASVAASVELQSNSIAQLGVAFEKVIQPLQRFASAVAEPVAQFLAKNITALSGVFALLAIPIVKAAIPALDGWRDKSLEATAKAKTAYREAREEIERLTVAQTQLKLQGADPGAAAQAALQGQKGLKGGALKIQSGDFTGLSKRELSGLLTQAEKGRGIIAKLPKEMKTQYLAALREMKNGTKTGMAAISVDIKNMSDRAILQFKKIKAAWAATMSAMKRMASLASRFINRVMKLAGMIGILLLIKDVVVGIGQSMGFGKQADEAAELGAELETLNGVLGQTIKQFSKFVEIQEKYYAKNMGDGITPTLEGLGQVGNFIDSNASSMIDALKTVDKYNKAISDIKAEKQAAQDAAQARIDAVQKEIDHRNENKKKLREFYNLEPGQRLNSFQQTLGNDFGPIAMTAEMSKELKNAKEERDAIIEQQSDFEKSFNPGFLQRFGLGFVNVSAEAEKAETNIKKLAGQMVAGLRAGRIETQAGGARFIELAEILRDTGTLSEGLRSEFEELQDQLVGLGAEARLAKQEMAELDKLFSNKITGITGFSTSVTDLISRTEKMRQLFSKTEGFHFVEEKQDDGTFKQVKKTGGRLQDTEGASVFEKEQGDRLSVLNKIREKEIGLQLRKLGIQVEVNALMVGATDLMKEEIKLGQQLATVESQKIGILNDLALIRDSDVQADKAKAQQLMLQLELLYQQEGQLRRNADIALSTLDSMTNAFQNQFSTGLADIIKGKESSFSDMIGKAAIKGLEAAADNLAKNMTKSIFGMKEESPEEKIKTGMMAAADYHAGAILNAIKGTDTTPSIIPKGTGEGGSITLKDIPKDSPVKVPGLGEGVTTNKDGSSVKIDGDSFTNKLDDIMGSNAPFIDKLGNTFDLSIGKLGSGLSAGFGELFAGLKGIGGGLLSIFGFASGGIASPGKKFAGYSEGGIASGSRQGYPAVLHGTEAVVPLPNGKSIPVEMAGSGSTQNNVTVNVSTEGSVQTESSDGSDSEALGKAVAAAVKEELQNQKRSGGILNPYGVA